MLRMRLVCVGSEELLSTWGVDVEPSTLGDKEVGVV